MYKIYEYTGHTSVVGFVLSGNSPITDAELCVFFEKSASTKS